MRKRNRCPAPRQPVAPHEAGAPSPAARRRPRRGEKDRRRRPLPGRSAPPEPWRPALARPARHRLGLDAAQLLDPGGFVELLERGQQVRPVHRLALGERLLEHRHGVLHAAQRCRGQQTRVDHHRHAQLLELPGREQGRGRARAQAEAHVDAERLLDAPHHGADVLDRQHGVGEQQVGAGLGVEIEPADRLVEPVRTERVGARHDDEVGIDPCRRRRRDLLGALLGRDHRLALEVAAALRPLLVLDHQPGEAGLLERLDGEVDVDRVAVAGIAVGEHGQIATADQRPADAQVLLGAHDAVVGPAEARLADAAPADEAGGKARTGDHAGAVAVIDARQHQDLGGVDQAAQGARLLGHRGRPPSGRRRGVAAGPRRGGW